MGLEGCTEDLKREKEVKGCSGKGQRFCKGPELGKRLTPSRPSKRCIVATNRLRTQGMGRKGPGRERSKAGREVGQVLWQRLQLLPNYLFSSFLVTRSPIFSWTY